MGREHSSMVGQVVTARLDRAVSVRSNERLVINKLIDFCILRTLASIHSPSRKCTRSVQVTLGLRLLHSRSRPPTAYTYTSIG